MQEAILDDGHSEEKPGLYFSTMVWWWTEYQGNVQKMRSRHLPPLSQVA